MDSQDPRDAPGANERQGGKPLGDAESRDKGQWAQRADQGVVPDELGQSAAEREPDQEGELGGAVVGATTGSEEPATEGGVDLSAGENADATTDDDPATAPGDEPDLKDAASGPRQADLKSADAAEDSPVD